MEFPIGSLVTARDRNWTVEAGSTSDFLLLRPTGGQEAAVTGVFRKLEKVRSAEFPLPSPDDFGPNMEAARLRTAIRIGFESSAGPFRSLAGLGVEPRQYQLVPLLLALRQNVVRMLIADDVGIGKTIEAGLIAKELLASGGADRMTVLCPPALAEQWQQELRQKFGIEAVLVLPSTVRKLQRKLPDQSRNVFQEYPYTVVSLDFIKQEQYRHTFKQHCPELVIVDEAHTCVPDMSGSGTPRHARYELVKALAEQDFLGQRRHMILISATPHSGKGESFQKLVGLLDPRFESFEFRNEKDREELARHFVQRRRADIRQYLGQQTGFPKDRNSKEVSYSLDPEYADLFREILNYTRDSVRLPDGSWKPRKHWWAALTLLRALASSPAAAAKSLANRAVTADAETDEDADAIGRAIVLDAADYTGDAPDVVPGGDDTEPDSSESRKLKAWAARAREMAGTRDAKLRTLIREVEALLLEGYDPIVFCRFIETAKYVQSELQSRLRKKAAVTVITGEQPPDDRLDRVDLLNRAPAGQRQVLVATDCLSEGVNLQDRFNAVIHYDLAWNPTRHEQREGRVDRFGQQSEYVRALTIYGEDNGIDAVILDVLLRKHAAIRRDTEINVPVPDVNDKLIETIMQGMLSLSTNVGHQLALELEYDGDVQDATDRLHREWQSAADKEKASRSRFAQHTIKPEEVLREVEEVRAALGTASDIPEFVRGVLSEIGGGIRTVDGDGSGVFELSESNTLPAGLRHALGVQGDRTLRFRPEPPAQPSESVLERTDRRVGAIARYVIDTALDGAASTKQRPAHRCGVVRMRSIQTVTTLVVARYRFHLTLPARDGRKRRQVAEDVRVHAYTGPSSDPTWLDDPAEIEALLSIDVPDENTAPDLARARLERTLRQMRSIDFAKTYLNGFGTDFAERFETAHRRVREASREIVRGMDVKFQPDADVLGVYVFEPIHSAGEAR